MSRERGADIFSLHDEKKRAILFNITKKACFILKNAIFLLHPKEKRFIPREKRC